METKLNYETKLQANQVNTSINKRKARFSFFLLTLGYKTAKGSVVRGQEMLAIITSGFHLQFSKSNQQNFSQEVWPFHGRSLLWPAGPWPAWVQDHQVQAPSMQTGPQGKQFKHWLQALKTLLKDGSETGSSSRACPQRRDGTSSALVF